MRYLLALLITVFLLRPLACVELDVIDCGVDHQADVTLGDVDIAQYPWLGILYYIYNGESGETRAVATVALIQAEFVVACAADIGPMPKHNFRANSRVLLGEAWQSRGRRVRSYVLHPEYGATRNTVALVQLKEPVREPNIKPLCPPPQLLRNPVFYVVKFADDYDELKKQVLEVSHVPSKMCKDFYVSANLYDKRLRPPSVACAVDLRTERPCVWDAGAVLTARDVWGRWQLLGLGVRGPGCGAPSRYLDMMSYYPWLRSSLARFRQITISKINNHKYVLRGKSGSYQKFGACDDEERINLIYRDRIKLVTDNDQFQMMVYNMSMYQNVEYSCVTLQLVNATAVSEMRIKHLCTRYSYGSKCYTYKGSVFDISVYITYKESLLFDMFAWGWFKNMSLLDVHTWKWEEGTHYEDFTMTKVEYKGTQPETSIGYEPLDEKLWVPEFDYWTTTVQDVWSSTTAVPKSHDDIWEPPPGEEGYDFKPTHPPGYKLPVGKKPPKTTTPPTTTESTTTESTTTEPTTSGPTTSEPTTTTE